MIEMRRPECTLLRLFRGKTALGDLQAVNVHGNGRSNKAWMGCIDGEEIDLPNLKAVEGWARSRGYRINRPIPTVDCRQSTSMSPT